MFNQWLIFYLEILYNKDDFLRYFNYCLKKEVFMKKYALMIAASGLFCMFQLQSSEKSLRVFKYDLLKAVKDLNDVYGDMQFHYSNIMDIARLGKVEASNLAIPLSQAASIVINMLFQRALDDIEGFVITSKVRQDILNEITIRVRRVFGLE